VIPHPHVSIDARSLFSTGQFLLNFAFELFELLKIPHAEIETAYEEKTEQNRTVHPFAQSLVPPQRYCPTAQDLL